MCNYVITYTITSYIYFSCMATLFVAFVSLKCFNDSAFYFPAHKLEYLGRMGKGVVMAEVAEKVVAFGGALKPGVVAIVGKVTRVRRYEKFYYTTVICPAKDEYSKPSIIEIRSNSRFADSEEKVSCQAEIGGYEGKAYSVTDRETGERKTLVPVNIFLDLVEK